MNNNVELDENHWHLFDLLEKIYRERFSTDDRSFGKNFDKFKSHMLYILKIMEKMYGEK